MPLPEPSSASFKRHYTDLQREAILDAVLRLEISQRAVTRHANGGTLPNPKQPGETLPAFPISRQTIANYVARGGDEYRAYLLQDSSRADATIAKIQGAAVAALERKLREYEDLTKAGDPPTVKQWQELVSAAGAARRMIRPPKPTNPAPGQNEPTGRGKPTRGKEAGKPDILGRMGIE